MIWVNIFKVILNNLNKKNVIFIHVPKTGGGSVENVLLGNYFKDFNDESFDLKKEREKIHSIDKKWAQHFTLNETASSRNITDLSSYFKFAFVRNPWDRMVSEYLYVKKNSGCGCRGNIRRIPRTFNEYILKNFKCSWRNHVAPQWQFVCNSEKKISVDFLGRFENFEEDLKKVFRTLEIDQDYKIPTVNQTQKIKQKILKPYWLYYDKQTKEIVEDKFQQDIRMFNYQFGGPLD